MSRDEMQLIAKNSGMSIGLFITFGLFIFFGGMALGSIRTTIETHENLPSHNGQTEMFVSRSEVDLQFKLLRNEVEKNRQLLDIVLLEVKK